jgi:hypothetical protein
MMLFACGNYIIEWLNDKEEVVKREKKYLTIQLYHREIMNMQTAFLRGMDVVKLKIKPC